MKKKLPTIAAVEKAIGIPAQEWKGRCFEIANLIVASKAVEGVAVYGHYLGPVHPESMFAGRPFVRHGWILTPTGAVVDPTRWTIVGGPPSIWVGDAFDYDEGGNRWRKAMLRPPPKWNPDARLVFLRLNAEAMRGNLLALTSKRPNRKLLDACEHLSQASVHVAFLLGDAGKGRPDPDLVTRDQLFWLANLPYDALSDFAPVIYRAIEVEGCAEFIPIDNRRRAEREYADRVAGAGKKSARP